MNESQSQFQFLEASVKLQRMQGKTEIRRKDLVQQILQVNPQSGYGTSTPFGANFTKHLRTIAAQQGGRYVLDKPKGPRANARIVF
jgi:hypothetical protein